MQAMASKMWIPFIAMGFMIVAISFIVGLVNSSTAADYYTASKVVREGAQRGSDLAPQRALIESTKVWLPAFKFLGMGILLGGVTFLLATILGALPVGGGRVQEALGVGVKLIKPPVTARLFPVVMMMGMMILMMALVVVIVLATLAYDYWNHSIDRPAQPRQRLAAGQPGDDQRREAMAGAPQVPGHRVPADGHRPGPGDDSSSAAVAGQPALGGPVVSDESAVSLKSRPDLGGSVSACTACHVHWDGYHHFSLLPQGRVGRRPALRG